MVWSGAARAAGLPEGLRGLVYAGKVGAMGKALEWFGAARGFQKGFRGMVGFLLRFLRMVDPCLDGFKPMDSLPPPDF